MRKIVFLITFIFVATTVMAHSGGTDSCGGHNNRKTGGYHVHNSSKYNACYPKKIEKKETKQIKKKSLKKDVSYDEIRDILISESISVYSGNCPCPYNKASNGSQCGKRSAWSRAGGYSPLCYKSDVTDDMILEYRKEHKLK